MRTKDTKGSRTKGKDREKNRGENIKRREPERYNYS